MKHCPFIQFDGLPIEIVIFIDFPQLRWFARGYLQQAQLWKHPQSYGKSMKHPHSITQLWNINELITCSCIFRSYFHFGDIFFHSCHYFSSHFQFHFNIHIPKTSHPPFSKTTPVRLKSHQSLHTRSFSRPLPATTWEIKKVCFEWKYVQGIWEKWTTGICMCIYLYIYNFFNGSILWAMTMGIFYRMRHDFMRYHDMEYG